MPESRAESQPGDNVDLWPEEIVATDITPPAAIMQMQASLLSKRTNYKLRGAVETTNTGRKLVHTFCIVAPSLEDYRYELFTVSHGVMPYPVEVMIAPNDVKIPPSKELKDEQGFLDWLRAVLSSGETKRVVGALLAQVKG